MASPVSKSRQESSSKLFIPCDAHEGPVWSQSRQKLFFAGKKQGLEEGTDKDPFVNLYTLTIPLEGTGYKTSNTSKWLLEEAVQLWTDDSNMANSMFPYDDDHLLVAEQGTMNTPSRIVKRHMDNTTPPEVIIDCCVDGEACKRFNSINKVIMSKKGHIIFTDPDYGYQQGFRPEAQRKPSVYVWHNNSNGTQEAVSSVGEKVTSFTTGLEMPHGLALPPDEKKLFITDTSGSHDDHCRKTVFWVDFDPDKGTIGGPPRRCFAVDEGMPDGSCTIAKSNSILFGGGDGIYCADLDGNLEGKIVLDKVVCNLCAFGEDEQHLFATVNDGIQVLFDWQQFVEKV